MTVSANANFELSRDTLIRRAFQLAGLIYSAQTPPADDLAMASDIMGMELDALQAEGIILRTVERTTQAITSITGAGPYTLAADTIDVVIGPENFCGTVQASVSDAETPVKSISSHEYTVNISMKGTTSSRPSYVLIEKLATVQLTFWPAPSANMTFKYQKIRLPKDVDTGAVTLDLARRFQKALCYAVAWQVAMAKSVPMERVDRLRKEAEQQKAIARSTDVEKGHVQMFVGRYC